MNIKLIYNDCGKNLQEILEENLIDFYYEFYECEIIKNIQQGDLLND